MTKADIKAKRAELMEKLEDAKSAMELVRTELRNLERRCKHPDGYATSCMGDPGYHCPDCGYSS